MEASTVTSLEDFMALPVVQTDGLGEGIASLGVTELSDLQYITVKDIENLCPNKPVVQRKLLATIQKLTGSTMAAATAVPVVASTVMPPPPPPVQLHPAQQINTITSSTDCFMSFSVQPQEELMVDQAFRANYSGHGGARAKKCVFPEGQIMRPHQISNAKEFHFSDKFGACNGGWLPPCVYKILSQCTKGVPGETYQLIINHTAQWLAAPAHCDSDQIDFDTVARELVHNLHKYGGLDEVRLSQLHYKPKTNLKRRTAGFRSDPPRGASKLWCPDLPEAQRCPPHFTQAFVEAVAAAASNTADGVRRQTQDLLVSYGLLDAKEVGGLLRIKNVALIDAPTLCPSHVHVTAEPADTAANAGNGSSTHTAKPKRRRLVKVSEEEEEEEQEEQEQEQEEEEEEEEEEEYVDLFDASDDDGAAEATAEAAAEDEEQHEEEHEEEHDDEEQQQQQQPNKEAPVLDTADLLAPLKTAPAQRHGSATQVSAEQVPAPSGPTPLGTDNRRQRGRSGGGGRRRSGGGGRRSKPEEEQSKSEEEQSKPEEKGMSSSRTQMVQGNEAASLTEACAIVAAAPKERKLITTGSLPEYMTELKEAAPQLLKKKYAKPLTQYFSQVRKWEKPLETMTPKQQALMHMVGRIFMIVSPTYHPANKKDKTPAHTTYSQDLAHTISPTPSGSGLNVNWLKLLGGRVFVVDLSWGSGASAVKLELFGEEHHGQEIHEIVRIDDGLFFSTVENMPFMASMEAFSSDAHVEELKNAKAAAMELKRKKKEEQDILDEQAYEELREQDRDNTELDPDNVLGSGKKRRRALPDQMAGNGDTLEQWCIKRDAYVENMRQTQAANPLHWRHQEQQQGGQDPPPGVTAEPQ
jgi:hypothetical protein